MHIAQAKLGQARAGDNDVKAIMKHAPEWVRTSNPVIRSPVLDHRARIKQPRRCGISPNNVAHTRESTWSKFVIQCTSSRPFCCVCNNDMWRIFGKKVGRGFLWTVAKVMLFNSYQIERSQNSLQGQRPLFLPCCCSTSICITPRVYNYRVSQNKGVRNGRKGCITVKLIIHPYII